MRFMAQVNVIHELEKRRGERTWQEVAAEIGCTPAYLSMVLNGKRSAGRKITAYLQIQEKTVYVKLEPEQ